LRRFIDIVVQRTIAVQLLKMQNTILKLSSKAMGNEAQLNDDGQAQISEH
jgi:hypothetical protein